MNNTVKVIGLLVLFTNASAIANDWSEAKNLQKLIKHLEASKAILAAAKASSNPNKRLQFDYEAFSKNINNMQSGVNFYLKKPLEPRSYEELETSFSHYENK